MQCHWRWLNKNVRYELRHKEEETRSRRELACHSIHTYRSGKKVGICTHMERYETIEVSALLFVEELSELIVASFTFSLSLSLTICCARAHNWHTFYENGNRFNGKRKYASTCQTSTTYYHPHQHHRCHHHHRFKHGIYGIKINAWKAVCRDQKLICMGSTLCAVACHLI